MSGCWFKPRVSELLQTKERVAQVIRKRSAKQRCGDLGWRNRLVGKTTLNVLLGLLLEDWTHSP